MSQSSSMINSYKWIRNLDLAGMLIPVAALTSFAQDPYTLEGRLLVDDGKNIVIPNEKLKLGLYGSSGKIVFSGETNLDGAFYFGNIVTSSSKVGTSKFGMKLSSLGRNVNLDLNTSYNQEIDIEIFDLLGRRINAYSKNVSSGGSRVSFNIGDVSDGQYIIRARGKEGVIAERVVVNGNEVISALFDVPEESGILKSAQNWRLVARSHSNKYLSSYSISFL
jgi:Secretion system C-terminal sorting domain